MEHGRIEREIHIDASPEVVFDVVSNPVHVRQWWPDEADYAPEPGGAGRIGFRQGDGSVGWAQIEVVDHGPGVDLATADRLFRPFVRNDASRSRRDHGGAGLGLALVDRIARQHGGSVAVTETRGGGSTFTLRLPVASNL